ncbi:MAG TPA: glycosyltransferase family 2 protein [Candidatus Margulisiibacteriota bacterium]|nr:glycosyltransferase family 2 protein [Candidatus Margulisiibacteriota bacterium]
MEKNQIYNRHNRTLEIIPGALSWGVIFLLILFAYFKPVACALIVIVFDFYWIIRTGYLTTLLIMAYHKLARQKDNDWLAACQSLGITGGLERLFHLIIFPVYKEGPDILRASLDALKNSHYPKERMIVVVAYEERYKYSRENALILEKEFKGDFFAYLSTFHPDGLAGETRTKGANATWGAKAAKQFLDNKGINYENVVISCFDADTCVDKEYFGCLAYHFLTSPKPHQSSYQPMPVYNNNIWYAPSFARLVEISASFCQMIESMRLEKFVTFSSHSMSFKTLVEIGYWPTDMVSDDSMVYWKAFLFFKGDYRVIPLYITVSMDAAYSRNLFKTLVVQYKQKRRWAWGVENFPFVVSRFLKDDQIPLLLKIRRTFNLLESHVTWALWAVIIVVAASLPILLGGAFFARVTAIGYNLPKVTGLLFNCTLMTSIIWILLSRTILPPRPKEVKWVKNLVMASEWVLVPFIVLILGSTPALDAQTRLMLAKYMEFNPTEKTKKVV